MYIAQPNCHPNLLGRHKNKNNFNSHMNSHNYYSSSSSRQGPNDRRLPSIRDVLGEELERHGGGRTDPYALNDVGHALPSLRPSSSNRQRDPRGPTLPPFRNESDPSHRHEMVAGIPSGSRGRGGGGHPSHHPAAHPPGMHHVSHDVTYNSHTALRPTTTGTLRSPTPAAASMTPLPYTQGRIPYGGVRIPMPQAHENEAVEKRHKCEYCGKKFDRPSSLQVHVRTHTGSQPFACDWPGCNRTFNVKSNMLRHYRSHERSGPNQPTPGYGSEDEEVLLEYPGKGLSSSTPGGQSSTAAYYTSSGR